LVTGFGLGAEGLGVEELGAEELGAEELGAEELGDELAATMWGRRVTARPALPAAACRKSRRVESGMACVFPAEGVSGRRRECAA
jgi:hypothetical protein